MYFSALTICFWFVWGIICFGPFLLVQNPFSLFYMTGLWRWIEFYIVTLLLVSVLLSLLEDS
jgi:hypothetical protein